MRNYVDDVILSDEDHRLTFVCGGQEICFDTAEEAADFLAQAQTELDFWVESHRCEYALYPGTRVDPPEYCDNTALPGWDFCNDHNFD